jgi:hypothetical protein
MKKAICFALVAISSIGLLQARDKRPAVPSKILSARTVFIDNQTPDAELQLIAVMGLNKWGRYDIVDSPQKADIVLRLIGSTFVRYVPVEQVPAKYDPKPVTGATADGEELAPAGFTRIQVVEPKSGTLLWEEIRKTGNIQEKSRLVEGLHDAVDQQERARR